MAVGKNNTRITITMTKRQVDWLEKTSEKLGISVSKLIRRLINNNLAKIANYYTQEEWEKLIKIARTPWVFDEGDDDL